VGTETLLKEVEEKRKTALKQLEDEYGSKTAEVRKRTLDERNRILEASKAEAASLSQKEQARITGAATLQVKKMGFDATEKMLESNISALKQVLAEFADSKEYSQLLPRLVQYASKRLGGNIGVRCRAADAQAIKKAGAKVLSTDLPMIGGFKAESEDGNFELDLTFEEMLRTHDEKVRASIMGKE
jgi:vacuolar-type H+-ATPase subunit E/Vma4